MRRQYFLAAVILVLACVPPVYADLQGQAEGFECAIGADGAATITGYEGETDAFAIPQMLDGYLVTNCHREEQLRLNKEKELLIDSGRHP